VRQTWSQDRVFFLDASAGSARRRWALRLRLFSIATLTCHALRTPPQLYAHTAWARAGNNRLSPAFTPPAPIWPTANRLDD